MQTGWNRAGVDWHGPNCLCRPVPRLFLRDVFAQVHQQVIELIGRQRAVRVLIILVEKGLEQVGEALAIFGHKRLA